MLQDRIKPSKFFIRWHPDYAMEWGTLRKENNRRSSTAKKNGRQSDAGMMTKPRNWDTNRNVTEEESTT